MSEIVTVGIYVLKFLIPAFFCVLFRAFGLGYKSKKRLALGLIVYLTYSIVVPSFLICTMGYGEYTHISILVMLLGSLSVLIFTTDNFGITMFLQMTGACMNTVISVILNMVRSYFSLSYPMLVLMIAVVFPIVYVFALKYWAKPLRFMADNIHAEVPTLVVLPLIVTAVVNFLPIYPAESFWHHPIYITVMMLAVESIYFLFIYSFYHNLVKTNRLLKDETKAKLLEAEIISYKDSLNAAKQARHDLRHHDAVVLEYLNTGDTAGAIEYLSVNDRALDEGKPAEFSGNPTANAVLRIYSRRAREAGIAFAANADIPENLPMTAPQLGALLSNLLENAVEACAHVERTQRQISFAAQSSEQQLRIEIRNSVCGTVEFDGDLPKSTKAGGGTGTKSVAKIVEIHGGMLRFKQSGQEFITQIVLPMAK